MLARIARMQQAPGGLALTIGRQRVTLKRAGKTVGSWPFTAVQSLTTAQARDIANERGATLLVVSRAAPGALALLRDAEVPYVTDAGEWFLIDPPELLIVNPAERRTIALPPSSERPLGKGAARIARWLLLHPQATSLTISDLADRTAISGPTASRAVRHLAERLLVDVSGSRSDSRRRFVRTTDRGQLLDALADEGQWRRARRVSWDIGARTPDQALRHISEAASKLDVPYAIGELAGAAFVERLVEPAAVTLWLVASDIDAWAEALLAEPSTPASGAVVARVVPDPWVLEWASSADDLAVADLIQLYIDCMLAGERAIDAAEMLRSRIIAA